MFYSFGIKVQSLWTSLFIRPILKLLQARRERDRIENAHRLRKQEYKGGENLLIDSKHVEHLVLFEISHSVYFYVMWCKLKNIYIL